MENLIGETRVCKAQKSAAGGKEQPEKQPRLLLNAAALRQSCSRCPGALQGAEPAPSQASPPPGARLPLFVSSWGFLSPPCTEKPSHSAAKWEVLRGFVSQLRIDACECIPTHLQYLAARKERENPPVPSYQHSGEHKGTWQKLLGVLYTSHWSQFTPLGKSTSPEDSSQLSPCLQGILLVCAIISI